MNRRSILALGAVAGPVLFTLAWVVLGFASTGYTLWGVHVTHYNAVQQQISALGVGNTAPYMNTAFVVTGVLLVTGTVGIFTVLGTELTAGHRAWSLALWTATAAGSVVDGIFTFEHVLLHFAGFALSLLSVAGFAVTGHGLRRSPAWRNVGRWLMVAAPLTVALAVLFFVTFTPTAAGQLIGVAGFTERILVSEILWWYALLGWLAFRGRTAVPSEPARTGSLYEHRSN